VGFTVDAFPDRQFRGKVQQVRLSATNTSNVITYPVVVAVDNADQSLLPGMTANAEIEVSRRDDVLRVPNAALRFKPAEEDTAGASQAPGAAGRGGVANDLPRVAAALKLDAAQQQAFDDALDQMRERMASRAAAPQQSSGGGSTLFGGGMRMGGGGGGGAGGGNSGQMRQRMQERFRQQFASFRATLTPPQQAQWDAEINALVSARRAPLYRLVDGKPQGVTVRVGASDGSFTEVSGDIAEGDTVVTGSGRSAK
jgi:HlyD family secretion protein